MDNYKKLRNEYIDLLEKINQNLTKQLNYSKQTDKNKKQGVVYVINQVGTQNYKIGISTNYRERLNLFTVKLPFQIKEVAVYETPEYVQKEKELHDYFKDKRLNNSEFFELSPDDLSQIPEIIYTKIEDGVSLNEDHLIEQAIQICKDNNKASTSLLQRKLAVGYARASRIMDILEKKGFVSKSDGIRPRELL